MDYKTLMYAKGVKKIVNEIGKASSKLHRKLQKMHKGAKNHSFINAQGENQHFIDDYADQIFLKHLFNCGAVHSIVSEEQKEKIITGHKGANLMVAIDPLDGSSNLDTNIPVGTIFGIYINRGKRYSGKLLMASGYIIFGHKTEMVITDGRQTHCYLLKKDKFKHAKQITGVSELLYYSVNEGNHKSFDTDTKQLITECKNQKMSLRYAGSMVADIHRNIQKGGVFMYPATSSYPEGKLRMLYECMPMALIAQSIGEMAVTGSEPTLNRSFKNIHQRGSIVVGNKEIVRNHLSRTNMMESNRLHRLENKSLNEKVA